MFRLNLQQMDVHALIYIYDLYPQTLLKHIFTCILLHSISLPMDYN